MPTGLARMNFCSVESDSFLFGEITFSLQHMVYGCDCFLSALDTLILACCGTVMVICNMLLKVGLPTMSISSIIGDSSFTKIVRHTRASFSVPLT